MNIKTAIELEEESHKRRMAIRLKKAHDYAKDDADCLSNFKVMAAVAKALEDHGYKIDITTPQGVAAWHMLHKFVRVLNLWNDKKSPKNESIIDTHDDMANYNDLAKECYIDYINAKSIVRHIGKAMEEMKERNK